MSWGFDPGKRWYWNWAVRLISNSVTLEVVVKQKNLFGWSCFFKSRDFCLLPMYNRVPLNIQQLSLCFDRHKLTRASNLQNSMLDKWQHLNYPESRIREPFSLEHLPEWSCFIPLLPWVPMSVMLTFGSNKDMQIQIRSSQDLFIYSSSWLSKPHFFPELR